MANITKDTPAGAQFTGETKILAEARVFAFSGGRLNAPGWPAKNIHTDLEFARACGLPTRSVSATQYMGYLAELMVDLFGERWLYHGKMDLKFFAIIDVDDRLVSKAVVISKEPEGSDMRFNLDVWCQNQHGNKVAVGTATGLVS